MKKWLIDNVISQVPLVGPLFLDKKWSMRIYMFGMSASMLFLGTYFMKLNLAGRKMDDSSSVAYFKSMTNMFIGMALAGITYTAGTNVLKQVGLFVTEGFRVADRDQPHFSSKPRNF